MVKKLPATRETQVRSLGWEDPLEKGMATHSSILAWRIPWTEEPGGLYSPCGRKELDTTEQITLSLGWIQLDLLMGWIWGMEERQAKVWIGGQMDGAVRRDRLHGPGGEAGASSHQQFPGL